LISTNFFYIFRPTEYQKRKNKSYFVGSLGRAAPKPWPHGYIQMMDEVQNNNFKQYVPPLSKALNIMIYSKVLAQHSPQQNSVTIRRLSLKLLGKLQ
jgi:hypothetical protein